ncbi:phage integrase SAM-like domain-containing protein [Polaribacter cellanae]|uniref:Phage integrase SAM-like domain-containing protein n=1 Tax=Polaribacter cellanae TaxID=2818493 RepID=A0A975CM70_9FLAO|nr:phage integrase SAM-like domain-containing protein [Polaribacter cellanae]QTE22218.1 phage integrase SAM-like domain-containing protein [Polaribacter cellanae]
MATIKFILQSKKENAPIYLRLTLGRNKDIFRKTGLLINPKDWSTKTRLPKQNFADNKNLSEKLKDLDTFITKKLNRVNDLEIINGDWLQNCIDTFFNRIKKDNQELHYLVPYGENFISNLDYKITQKGKKGVSKSTQKKYRTIVNKLIEFEKHRKKRILLKDVDLHFRTELIKFFSDSGRLSDNTIGRYLKFVKSICLDAQKNGIETNPQLNHFKGFTVKVPKITLSFDELEQIKKTTYNNPNHEITKDWLIIGCYTGQRVSDLLRMNSSFIQRLESFEFIVLEQIKTEKLVQIPIHQEVKKILDKRNGEFPPVFAKNIDSNKTLFNRYLKQVCKIAEIDEVVQGNAYDSKRKRTIEGEYEKYKFVSSHICRRSFATNFYGDPKYSIPLLMNITAHSTEKMFLEYIGKKPLDYGLQLAQIWANEALKEQHKEKPQLEVIKNVATQ